MQNFDKDKNGEFIPPRHWLGPEELEASYWADPKVLEKRSQEFYEKPVEWVDLIDRTDKEGLARRDFLTIMGASMAMATFACARRPVNKIIPYVVKPEEITPGVANWYASTCQECSVGCGVLVKNREGRPIKLEGNPEHPLNQGKLCGRGQASILNLYDPDRLKNPITRSRGEAGRALSWAEADSKIGSALSAAAQGGGKVRILSGAANGKTSTVRLMNEFLGAFKDGALIHFDPLSSSEIAEAQAISYGKAVIPQYRFDQADLVVSLGADFLGTWLSPVEHSLAWVKRRKLDGQKAANAQMSKLVVFESTMTLTGANADERHAVRPGDELKIAMAIAHELIASKKYAVSGAAASASVMAAVSGYEPAKVAAEIGIQGGAAAIEAIARDLWKARGKSLVVGGGIASQTKEALGLQVAINLLNTVLENDGSTVDGTMNFAMPAGGTQSLTQLIQDMKSGKVSVLILHRANPIYALPKSLGFEEALKNVKTVITVSTHDDETAVASDMVLPDHHYLENWGDANPRQDLYSLQQPSMAPIHSTRAFEDGLIAWVKNGGLRVSGPSQRMTDWHEYLKANWQETIYHQYGVSGAFEQFWEGALRDGVFDGKAARGQTGGRAASRSFQASVGEIPKYASRESGAGFILALYPKVSMRDGRSANNAWLQEMPDPVSCVTWDNYVNVAPSTAKKLGWNENDVVRVASGDVAAELPVHVQPGMHPSVLSVAVGYGRRNAGKVGTGAGVDVHPFVQMESGKMVFSGQSVEAKKTFKLYNLASTQWHTATENRPIINDITLAEYRKNPETANHTDPHLRLKEVPTLWPVHEYKGYRWGMAIDMNSCTGCSACMIACQAENNVPVVGRDQVRVSRQMHWIRIDRYYGGSADNPTLVFQPMLCQHCENAPCETVCPVLATVHDDEGLNVQVYNRCVGTRYCQNNCPYKVRRFNFFDHWKSYDGTMNLVWNPDVTVRSRGIMEKCTFCVQRIRDVKDKMKDQGEKVHDGDIQTACQQTCPTDAIVFGDINDPNSRVSKLRADARAYRVLEVLNAKPSISYLTKVRNIEGSGHAENGGSQHGHH